MGVLLVNSNSLSIPLADKSVHCCVTSPPYWALRDYGVDGQLGLESLHDCLGWATGAPCGECYICHMVQIFREVRRVLRDDGTAWVNLGDSYSNMGKNGGQSDGKNANSAAGGYQTSRNMRKDISGLKPKDMVGIPWRVAFALQADGWYLRSDIIWNKPNPMPESVTDRPSRAHEYLFLLAKSSRYFFDQDAVREPFTTTDEHRESVGGISGWALEGIHDPVSHAKPKNGAKKFITEKILDDEVLVEGPREDNPNGRNVRTVWTITPERMLLAHFATYPRKLVEPCIKAGTSERGACSVCGAPWVRVTDKEFIPQSDVSAERVNYHRETDGVPGVAHRGVPRGSLRTSTAGWRATCKHDVPTRPAIVFDPFAGSGTTGLVARILGRSFIGLDLSRTYLVDIARKRLELDLLDAWTDGIATSDNGFHDLPLFQEGVK